MGKIVTHSKRNHSKASESYIDVTFEYDDGAKWEGSIPIEYRRTGIELTEDSDIEEYLNQVYTYCHPNHHLKWREEQEIFWKPKVKAAVTKSFFNALLSFEWTCVACQLPANPNWVRRIQDLKEFGYTIATDIGRECKICLSKKTHTLLIPIPRGGISGYEVWSPELRIRIIDILKTYDAYEDKYRKKDNLLPDHKFPEIRWGNDTKRDSIEHLTTKDIKEQFQLLSNQRNLHKREVCRKCSQTNIRGYPFGIKYYYQGNQDWEHNIPSRGKLAQAGCVGCGWYDLAKWRTSLNERLNLTAD